MTDLHVNIVCNAESHQRDGKPQRTVKFTSFRFEGPGTDNVSEVRTYMMPNERESTLKGRPAHVEVVDREGTPRGIGLSSMSTDRSRLRIKCQLCGITAEAAEMGTSFGALRRVAEQEAIYEPDSDTLFADVELAVLAAIVRSKL